MAYALPMIDVPTDSPILGSLAIQALEKDLGRPLLKATAAPFDYLAHSGKSKRTGEDTLYEYWSFTVEPGETLNVSSASTQTRPPIFVSYDELIVRQDVTWSTVSIAKDFVDNQEVALAMVTRSGETEPEYLLVWNDNYHGYFFPAQRVKLEAKPDRVAAATVRADLNYRGPVESKWCGEVQDIHFSNRYTRDRLFRFHICDVQLPEVDLHQPYNPIELAPDPPGKKVSLASRQSSR